MIDITKISTMAISPDVKTFMDYYGGNHVSLYKGWREQPDMHTDPSLLQEQLAYALQNGSHLVAKRVLGRMRSLHSTLENQVMGELSGKTDAFSCLQ